MTRCSHGKGREGYDNPSSITVTYADGTKRLVAHERCWNCRETLSLGHSDESPAWVAVEIRAAEIAADKRAKMSMCEAFGWESWLVPKFSTDPVDDGYSRKWHAGYLARCLATTTPPDGAADE